MKVHIQMSFLSNPWKTTCDLWQHFLDMIYKRKRWTWLKLGTSAFCKTLLQEWKKKKNPYKWEKTFANNMSNKGFRFRKHKELLKLNKKINKFFKWAKELNRHIIKDIQMWNKYVKDIWIMYWQNGVLFNIVLFNSSEKTVYPWTVICIYLIVFSESFMIYLTLFSFMCSKWCL